LHPQLFNKKIADNYIEQILLSRRFQKWARISDSGRVIADRIIHHT